VLGEEDLLDLAVVHVHRVEELAAVTTADGEDESQRADQQRPLVDLRGNQRSQTRLGLEAEPAPATNRSLGSYSPMADHHVSQAISVG